MNSYSCCSQSGRELKHVVSLSALLKVVSEESRLQLLCILRSGKHCVCEMVGHGDLSQSLISHHLRDLKDEGIVVDKKRGLRVYYELTARGKRVVDVLFSI